MGLRGVGDRLNAGGGKMGVQSLQVALAGLKGAGREAQNLPCTPSTPWLLRLLARNTHSSGGTYVLLFLGD